MNFTESAHAGTFLWALVQLADGKHVRRDSWEVGRFVSSQEEILAPDRFCNDWSLMESLEADQCN